MQEVFNNIIGNAIKFSDLDGKINIKTKIENNFLKIIIKDVGVGISSKDLKKIFTPYFRAENVNDIEGTGLGLYITKKLIEEVGGKIEIDSVLKVGTTIVVYLPIINIKNN